MKSFAVVRNGQSARGLGSGEKCCFLCRDSNPPELSHQFPITGTTALRPLFKINMKNSLYVYNAGENIFIYIYLCIRKQTLQKRGLDLG